MKYIDWKKLSVSEAEEKLKSLMTDESFIDRIACELAHDKDNNPISTLRNLDEDYLKDLALRKPESKLVNGAFYDTSTMRNVAIKVLGDNIPEIAEWLTRHPTQKIIFSKHDENVGFYFKAENGVPVRYETNETSVFLNVDCFDSSDVGFLLLQVCPIKRFD